MQHSAIVKKQSPIIVFAKSLTDMPNIQVWKMSNSLQFEELNSTFIVLSLIDNYYKCRIYCSKWRLLFMYQIC